VGCNENLKEKGIITSKNTRTVFVRYGRDINSKGTYPRDLEPIWDEGNEENKIKYEILLITEKINKHKLYKYSIIQKVIIESYKDKLEMKQRELEELHKNKTLK
jgi:hypothetical protein